ncbi:MAG TPA: RNA polymerase sigma factor [Bacteroidia bacterium]|nr:RNA polymerase sigma factor [Bacteroidia bacterium]
MTEEQLLSAIRENPQVFEEVFRRYYTPVFGYILRRTGNIDDAADIAAETFYKAFVHIRKFEYRGISIKVWLYRIATNELNMFFRFRKKQLSVFSRWDAATVQEFRNVLHHDREMFEAELKRHERYLDVLKSLKQMPVNYQEVIALKYFESKSIREISEITGRSEGTVKSLLPRGVKKLQLLCNQK